MEKQFSVELQTKILIDALEGARYELGVAIPMIESGPLKGYATKLRKEVERLKAIEWPLRGVHPDEIGPPRRRE